MRHQAATLATWALLCPVVCFAGAGGASKAPQPASFQEQRSAFVDLLDGWSRLAKAEGETFAELASKVEGIRAHAAALKEEKGQAALKALAKDRGAFEQWKRDFLKKLYEAKQGGRLSQAPRAARRKFANLAETQVDAFRRLAHRPFIAGPELKSLEATIVNADAPGKLGRMFDNELERAGVTLSPVLAEAAPPVEAASLAEARTVLPMTTSELFSAAGAPRLADRAVRPASYSVPSRSFSAAAISVPSPETPETTGAAPLAGSGTSGNMRSWQRELLAATGAWKLLSAVGVNPERFLAALTGAESGYSVEATSSAGAAGAMQVMPGTARGILRGNEYRQLAAKYGLPVYRASGMSDEAIQRMLNRDWRTNILLGILYIKDQADSFGDYVSGLGVSAGRKAQLMMNMVASAYNAGPGRVFSALDRLSRKGISLASVNPTDSLVHIRETQNYVSKILRDYGPSWL